MPANKPTDRLLPLTLEEYANERRLPKDWLAKTFGLKDTVHDGIACVEQPYTRLDGTAAAPRYRYANMKKSPAGCGDQIVLYGQQQLINKNDPDTIILVEGESDTQTFRYAAFNVLGIPGTSMWDKCLVNQPEIASYFASATTAAVFVVQEPASSREKAKKLDSPTKMLANIRTALPFSRVIPLRLWEYAPRDENGEPLYKDVSGLWMYCDGNSVKFQRALTIAARAAAVKDGVPERKIHSVLASEVEMKLTRWLWEDHIPLGELTVFAGMPQKGKSTAAIDVVSRLTNGRDFPGSPKQIEACEVAVLASEDNMHTTTVPRLAAAGAARDKVHLIQGTKEGDLEREIALDTDLERVRDFLGEHPEIKLIVMDPVTSYIGEVDPNKPKEVRPFLNRLKKFAEEMEVSLLLIMHLSKNPDVSALHRVGGAATWIEVPRSVWFFDLKKQDEESTEPPSYVMVNGKLNIVADERKKSMEYTFSGVQVRIEDELKSIGTIRWGTESTVTLEQQYGGRSTKDKPGPSPVKLEAAMDWLKSYLAEGPRKSRDVFAEGEAAGHKKDTLYTAKDRLGVKVKHSNGGWLWELPEVTTLST
jgi:hypothetical protein